LSDRRRLRPAHTPDELARIYARPHDHTPWQDHVSRVECTVAFARSVIGPTRDHAADLSCGDGAVLDRLEVGGRRIFGDFAPGHELTGPIEATVEQIPRVDLFVCCETLEHLDDPDLVLKQIRAKTRVLLLSTPVEAWEDTNLEHYWAWTAAGVDAMLMRAGFAPHAYMQLDYRPAGGEYAYGVWIVR
jgi:hypothetical protein